MNRSESDEVLLSSYESQPSVLLSITDKDEVLIVGNLPPTPDQQNGFFRSYVAIFRAMSWRQRLIIITACTICFSGSVCYSVAFPFLPFVAEQKGNVSAFSVGMILGSFELTVFVFSIFIGIYMAKIGIWFLFIAGALIEGVCACLFGFLVWCPGGNTFITMAIAVRCVEALGCSMCLTATLAVIAQEFPHHTALLIGFIEAFEGFGFMSGPLIGGALYELGGFLLPFVVTGVCLCLCGIGSYCLLPTQHEPSTVDEPPQSFLKFLTNPIVMLSGLFITSSAMLTTFYDPTLPVQLAFRDSKFATSPALIGVVFFLDSVTYSLVLPVVGYLADRFHNYLTLLVIGNVGFLVAYLLMGPFPLLPISPMQPWPLILAIGLTGFFVSFGFMPTFPAMIDACVKSGMEENVGLLGLVSGFFASAFSLGSFIGPLAGGYLVDAVGFAWASSIMCLFPIVNLLCTAAYALAHVTPRC